MTPEEQFRSLYEQMARLCREQRWGDPFSYARAKEIYAATVLGHTVAPTYAGADAFNQKGEPVEYKSTTAKNPKGSYTGISVQETWAAQDRYLLEEKLAKYPEHYYNRFDKTTGKLAESWVLPGDVVYRLLRPKLKKKFFQPQKDKDPRLKASITWGEIKKYGKRII